MTALSGLSNRQQVSRDNPNLGLYQDVPHLINGAQVMLYGVGSATLGFHGVTATFGDSALRNESGILRLEEPIDATIVGMDAELYGLAGLDWYFEGNVFQYYDDALSEGGEHDMGYTGYVSASAYHGILVVYWKENLQGFRTNQFVYLYRQLGSRNPSILRI